MSQSLQRDHDKLMDGVDSTLLRTLDNNLGFGNFLPTKATITMMR